MIYELVYTREALKSLKKLDKESKRRILNNLERCRVRPHAFVKKLVGSPYFRLRTGNYRVIVDIQRNKFVLMVIEVGHRKNIYR